MWDLIVSVPDHCLSFWLYITYYYKYKICLDVIFNCFGETYFSEFMDFVFTSLCEKDFGFQEKDLG